MGGTMVVTIHRPSGMSAEEFLKKGMATAGSLPELQSELAQARFYSAGPQASLAERREF